MRDLKRIPRRPTTLASRIKTMPLKKTTYRRRLFEALRDKGTARLEELAKMPHPSAAGSLERSSQIAQIEQVANKDLNARFA